MKTIFEQSVREEVMHRIMSLKTDSGPVWGKMNCYQMMKHCCVFDEWIQGTNDLKPKQSFMGKLFGRNALKQILSNKPFPLNAPAGKLFTVREIDGDIEAQRTKWIANIKAYAHYHNPDFVHDFFGKMTKEQIGILVYKHNDHHLRQFNA